jgi:uncharacterized membrane protein
MSRTDYPNIERAVRVVDGLLGLVFFMIKSVFWLVVIVVAVVLMTK